MFTSTSSNQNRSSKAQVEVFGTNWCADTQKVRRYLDRQGIPYVYHNMEREQAATRQVQWWTGGTLSHPTIQVGGQILVEPSLNELTSTLNNFGIL